MDLTTKDQQDFYLFKGLGKNSRLGAMGIFDQIRALGLAEANTL